MSPMPPPPNEPTTPKGLVGIITDRDGNNIGSGVGVVIANETQSSNYRELIRANGEIIHNLANMPTWAENDIVRIQVHDGFNHDVWFVKVSNIGIESITRSITPLISIDRHITRKGLRGLVKR